MDKRIPRSVRLNDCELTKAKILSVKILGEENVSGLVQYFLNNWEIAETLKKLNEFINEYKEKKSIELNTSIDDNFFIYDE